MHKLMAILVIAIGLLLPAGTANASIRHIVLIMEENHNRLQAAHHMPYLTGLGKRYAHASSYYAITHPSLPNYFAITAGSTFGVGSDCGIDTSQCYRDANNIFHQTRATQGGWAGWAEAMPGRCVHKNKSPYVVHHAVAPYFNNLRSCRRNDIPFNWTHPPRIRAAFTLLTPDNNHNGHSAGLGTADAWLRRVIPELRADPAYQNGSTLIEITFDEGAGGDQNVAAVFINPALRGVVVTRKCNHYSMLRLNEVLLGYSLLRNAVTAPGIRGALGL